MLSFLLRVKSPAPAHSLRSTSGEKRKIRHAEIQLQQKPKKKRKKEGYSCSFTINAKALCLSEKSIFPSVLHCTNGGGICISKWMLSWRQREEEAATVHVHAVCSMLSDCLWLLLFSPPTYFPTKTTRGQVRVTPRSGKLAPWESPKHGTITTGSVAGPSVDHGSTCLFGILASCNTTSVLSSTSEAWFVNKTLKKKKKPPGCHYVWPNIFLSSISHPNKTAATVFKLNVRQPYYPTSSLYAKLSMTLVLVNVWPGTQYQRSTAWTPLRRYLLQMTSLTQDGSACIQYILALSSYSVKKWRRVFLLLMCRCTGTRRCEVHWKSFLGNKCIFWC